MYDSTPNFAEFAGSGSHGVYTRRARAGSSLVCEQLLPVAETEIPAVYWRRAGSVCRLLAHASRLDEPGTRRNRLGSSLLFGRTASAGSLTDSHRGEG